LVIWDGASIHHGQAVKDFLATGAAKRLHLERLPSYAPDLNPDEGVWNHLKRGELKNRCCQDLDELRWELGLAIRRLRRKARLLVACFRHCGYVQYPMLRSVIAPSPCGGNRTRHRLPRRPRRARPGAFSCADAYNRGHDAPARAGADHRL